MPRSAACRPRRRAQPLGPGRSRPAPRPPPPQTSSMNSKDCPTSRSSTCWSGHSSESPARETASMAGTGPGSPGRITHSKRTLVTNRDRLTEVVPEPDLRAQSHGYRPRHRGRSRHPSVRSKVGPSVSDPMGKEDGAQQASRRQPHAPERRACSPHRQAREDPSYNGPRLPAVQRTTSFPPLAEAPQAPPPWRHQDHLPRPQRAAACARSPETQAACRTRRRGRESSYSSSSYSSSSYSSASSSSASSSAAPSSDSSG